MKNFTAAILLAFVCLSCGCAKYYYQEGKTLTECQQDFRECCADLKKYQDPHGEPDPARYNASYDYEGKFMDTCMKEHGYKIVSEKKLPLRVKREDPDRWVAKTRGLAGKLDE